MRKVIFSLTILVLVRVTLSATDVPAGIVTPYLRIQSSLAGDKLDSVKADAAAIAAESARIGAEAKTLESAARAVEAAGDLKAAREAFGRLSDALLQYAQRTKSALGADLAIAYCPMVKKSWVQKGEKIRNPYYGAQMLECGEVKKTKP